jgi:hypothetical protein
VFFTIEVEHCQSCGSQLIIKEHSLINGDCVTFICCEQDGYYLVYDKDSDSIVSLDDMPCEHDISQTSTKMPNGDRVNLLGCAEDGFYSVDWGGDEMLNK